MIDQPTIDRILDAANIVDVVSEFVTLRKRGINYVGLCPFHSDKSPLFLCVASKRISVNALPAAKGVRLFTSL